VDHRSQDDGMLAYVGTIFVSSSLAVMAPNPDYPPTPRHPDAFVRTHALPFKLKTGSGDHH
jgi:hypothetical protein